MKKIKTNNRSGQAIIELVITLPLLVLLMMAVYDFSRAVHTNNIISNVSREGANLASRSTLTKQQVMNTVAYTAQPLKMQNNGMIYLTVVKGVAGGTPVIASQERWLCNSTTSTTACSQASVASRIGTPGTTNPNPSVQNMGNFTLPANETANVVEVFYNYQPLFFNNISMLRPMMYSKTVL